MARVSIRRIGNSSGVVVPQSVIAELGLAVGDKLNLVLDGGQIVLAAVAKPRAGWAEAAQALAEAGEDDLVWPEFANGDDAEWQW